jgi:hypothetical protein
MRALVDRHHSALFYSLQLLFEDRLGIDVYTPIGHEWWEEGYWRFGQGYGDDRLAQQFLMNGTGDGHYPDRPIHGVTLEEFRAVPWDFVVATVQDNQHGFARLAQEVGAKYVLQVGNINQQVDWDLHPIALISNDAAPREQSVVYHQEFDSDTTFRYRPPEGSGRITSFMNCFPSASCHVFWEEAEALHTPFVFVEHGIDGRDGNVGDIADIADIMAGSDWGWHDKGQGDGFGHVIHQWAAIGRPLIGHGQHYQGLMAAPFWIDGVTCIDLD